MINNGNGTFTFTDSEWSKWTNDEAARLERIRQLEASYNANVLEINLLNQKNNSLKDNVSYLRTGTASLTDINTGLLEEIEALKAIVNPGGLLPTAIILFSVSNPSIVGTIINLDGSTSINNGGGTLTYIWSLTKPAGSNASITNFVPSNPYFITDIEGSYTVALVVSNGTSSSAKAVKIFTAVAAANRAPTAVSGTYASQDVTVNPVIQLDGSGSSDPDNNTLTYLWAIVSKPIGSTATLSGTQIVNPTIAADIGGDYQVSLIVNDGAISSSPSYSSITMSPAPTINLVPVANAGAPISSYAGAVSTLNGSASYDPENASLTYAWTLTTKPTNSAASITNPTTVNPTIAHDLIGTYVAELIVSDGSLFSAPSTVTLTITTAPVSNYLIEDFEGTLTGLIQLDSRTSVSTDYAYAGTKSLKKNVLYLANDTWQTPIRLGRDVTEGQSIWFRFRVYPPAGFDWTCNPIMKLMRLAIKNSSGTGIGYFSWLTTRSTNFSCVGTQPTVYGYAVLDDEAYAAPTKVPGTPSYFCEINTQDGYLTPGQWHTLEMHMYVSSTNGLIRGWHNGVKICETLNIPTVPAGGYIWRGDGNYTGNILSYWNGGVPVAQSIYFDDFAVSFETPTSLDAFGNPMIGT